MPRPAPPRPATPADVPFMDSLQRAHGRALGWFPTRQFLGYVDMGGALVAESHDGTPVGYVLHRDKYGGRDDVGAIYQVAVHPDWRRRNVGVDLVRAAIGRAAYGVKLYGCWCAQDLASNAFWQACGFVPLAFRTGSRTKSRDGGPRLHVYWQARVRRGDDTPWWYPYQTAGGAIREDRLVFPIPPGTPWHAAQPIILPDDARPPTAFLERRSKALEDKRQTASARRNEASAAMRAAASAAREAAGRAAREAERRRMTVFVHGRPVRMTRPEPTENGQPGGVAAAWAKPSSKPFSKPTPSAVPASAESAIVPASTGITPSASRVPVPGARHEKRAVAFCRELRDRYLEQLGGRPDLVTPQGRYDVSRGSTSPESAPAGLPAPRAALQSPPAA